MNICKPPDKTYEYGSMESTNEKSNVCTFLCFGIYTFGKIFAIMCVKAESGNCEVFCPFVLFSVI